MCSFKSKITSVYINISSVKPKITSTLKHSDCCQNDEKHESTTFLQ